MTKEHLQMIRDDLAEDCTCFDCEEKRDLLADISALEWRIENLRRALEQHAEDCDSGIIENALKTDDKAIEERERE